MINRENWKLVGKFLEYREQILQNDPMTIRSGWVALKHLLQWADATPFQEVLRVRPTLPEYLLHARNDGKPDPLSPAHMAKILAFSRNFFEWLRIEQPHPYRNITQSWINSLQLKRSMNPKSRLVRRQFWTLDEVIRVLETPTTLLRHQRDKAALAFIYLSAMRGGAFVTMPIQSVDLKSSRVYQLPEWGVQTKNSKAAITFLLPIPPLRTAVEEWDAFVRARAINGQVAWYTRLSWDGFDIMYDDVVTSRPASGRRSALYQGLHDLCELAHVEWKSPHKIRHGHGVYGLKHAKTMAEFKALSLNMMHETTSVTDKTYSVLVNDEVGEIIGTFKP